MSFGVYVTGVLFETASFVSFLLISHGYCITCERLSVTERRTTAALGCVFYLTLVGYRASVPYFSVSYWLINALHWLSWQWLISFYNFDFLHPNLFTLCTNYIIVSLFQVLLLVNYFINFYMIFHHISQNLLALREQLSFIEDEDVHAMHDAVYTKYIMFK